MSDKLFLESYHVSLKYFFSPSSLIRPSFTISATIFEKVFQPGKFLKTEYFPTKRVISLSSRNFFNFTSASNPFY